MGTLTAIGSFVDAAGGYGDDGGMAGDVLDLSRARTRHGHIYGILVMD